MTRKTNKIRCYTKYVIVVIMKYTCKIEYQDGKSIGVTLDSALNIAVRLNISGFIMKITAHVTSWGFSAHE